MSRRWALGWLLLGAVLGSNVVLPARVLADDLRPEHKKELLEIATAWLVLVDTAQYALAWEKASPFFQLSGAKEKWVNTVADGRRLVGDFVSRQLLEEYYSDTLMGVPERGEYYTLIFATNFNAKPDGIEIVFLIKDRDGEWRVGGYVVK